MLIGIRGLDLGAFTIIWLFWLVVSMVNCIFEDCLGFFRCDTLQVLEKWGKFDSFYLTTHREDFLLEIQDHADRVIVNQILLRVKFEDLLGVDENGNSKLRDSEETLKWKQKTQEIYAKCFKKWGYPPANSVVSIGGRTPRRLMLNLHEIM